jgi:hypothetical protein
MQQVFVVEWRDVRAEALLWAEPSSFPDLERVPACPGLAMVKLEVLFSE